MKRKLYLIPLFALYLINNSCNSEDQFTPSSIIKCSEGKFALFSEADSLLVIEFENAIFGEGWKLVRDLSEVSGEGYMRWEGDNNFSNPGKGIANYNLKISNPGTYRFIWKSAVTEGESPSEGNDSWLRFPDADDFYGKKPDGSLVYPNGSGKSPNPHGASKDGWFKIYRSGTPLTFKWQSRTSDNDAHMIYVKFNNPGIYKMEVSGRSYGHAIDKFVMYQEEAYTQNQVTEAEELSKVSCN
ncbi:hypothetical protein [Marinigracilibium pacificum]|uniref:Lipoprotein n=1 Tax=Marinigracilibium pacificum TaxID=2729599 RepID=A0A848IVX8_9BACT|nr:hypothetical protein [Marinigracilibium pacificum]NMM47846.1 hypothetical protein [Marinigracilibium pacificum]